MVEDEVQFYGHPNVQSLHSKTVEITTDEHLSLRGDCIIGVRANKGCARLDEKIQHRLKQNDTVVRMEIIVGNQSFAISGFGEERLSLKNTHEIVVRKTRFVCPRTMSVRCDKASSDLPRRIVELLQDSNSKGILKISVE